MDVLFTASVLAAHCCVRNYPKTQQLKTINILSHSFCASGKAAAQLSDSLVRLQARCWQGLQPSEGLPGAGGFAGMMVHSQGWQVSVGCWQKHLLIVWPSLQGCLSVLITWQLASPQVSFTFWVLALEVSYHHFCNILTIIQVSLQCG